MKRFISGVWRILKGAPLAILAPLLLIFDAIFLLLADILSFLRPRSLPADEA